MGQGAQGGLTDPQVRTLPEAELTRHGAQRTWSIPPGHNRFPLTVTSVSCNICFMITRREELIKKALNYMLKHGVAGLTLRPLAGKIGTSARLLVYHFGSKDGLITAVMDEVRARIQNSFTAALASPARKQASYPMRPVM